MEYIDIRQILVKIANQKNFDVMHSTKQEQASCKDFILIVLPIHISMAWIFSKQHSRSFDQLMSSNIILSLSLDVKESGQEPHQKVNY